jgi:hypothetical protein
MIPHSFFPSSTQSCPHRQVDNSFGKGKAGPYGNGMLWKAEGEGKGGEEIVPMLRSILRE